LLRQFSFYLTNTVSLTKQRYYHFYRRRKSGGNVWETMY